MSYASYIYKRPESNGTFYFRSPSQYGSKRFSLKTRILREAKQRAAICLAELQLCGRVDMGKYKNKFSHIGEGWLELEAEKITWVKENIADQIPEGRESDNAYLIKMFDIYTEKERQAETDQINKKASQHFGISEPAIQAPSQPITPPVEEVDNLSLQELIEEYIEAKRNRWKADHLEQANSRLGLICELMGGETKVRSLRRKDFSNLVKNLQLLPAKRNKQEYQNLTLSQLLQLDIPKQEKFSITTINAFIDRISLLFRYAVNASHVASNLTNDLKEEVNLREVKEKLKKAPYTSEELQLIIDCSWKKEKRFDRRFIPAIAMFSGMRQSEICQLKRADVIEEEGVWYFRVAEEEEGQSVKSKAGLRKIPIHSQLIAIGILNYIKSIRSGSLWPKLNPDNKGRLSGAIQKWFTRINRAHVTTDPAKTFHSTRHSVTTVLMNSGEQRHLYQKIIGHEHEEEETPSKDTTATYEGDIDLTLAQAIIEKIQYKPELNFELE